MNEVEMATEIYELKLKKTSLAQETKELNNTIKNRESELMDYLVEEGKSSTGHIEGVGNFILARSVYPSVPAGVLPTFINSLRGTPDFKMVKEMIPVPTLKAYLKTKIEETTLHYVDCPEDLDINFKEGTSPSQAANEIWEQRGVRIFDEVKLQHRNAGK